MGKREDAPGMIDARDVRRNIEGIRAVRSNSRSWCGVECSVSYFGEWTWMLGCVLLCHDALDLIRARMTAIPDHFLPKITIIPPQGALIPSSPFMSSLWLTASFCDHMALFEQILAQFRLYTTGPVNGSVSGMSLSRLSKVRTSKRPCKP